MFYNAAHEHTQLAFVYFCVVILLGAFICINLFIAVLYDGFAAGKERMQMDGELVPARRAADKDAPGGAQQMEEPYKSCLVFAPDHPLRRSARALVSWRWFVGYFLAHVGRRRRRVCRAGVGAPVLKTSASARAFQRCVARAYTVIAHAVTAAI